MSKIKKGPMIEPLIKFVNDPQPHVIDRLLSSENPPELTSIGVINVLGTNNYVSFVMFSKGNEVLRLEVGEPNLKLIVEDEAKINFVQHILMPKDYE